MEYFMKSDIASNCFVSAIIVAAGKGTRMNMDMNKQFIPLSGMPIVAHTINVFNNTPLINEIIVVVNIDDIEFVNEEIIRKYGFSKVVNVVCGGVERQSSVYNGILQVSTKSSVIAIHDGARPFVTPEIIRNTVEAAIENSSSVCAVKVKDTIKTASTDGFIDQTLSRETLWSIQTPQAFKTNIIIDAHKRAICDNYIGTDDAVLVERLGIKTKIVTGSYNNIKITTSEDLIFAQAIKNKQELTNN
jgi:2-C-methyl-D-erythritol 4-phosphate cytidylyltransferase